jgi:hypothetical protein
MSNKSKNQNPNNEEKIDLQLRYFGGIFDRLLAVPEGDLEFEILNFYVKRSIII